MFFGFSKRVPGSNPSWGFSVWNLHVLPLGSLQVHRFPPTVQKNMHGLIGDSKLTQGMCAWLCTSLWPCERLETCPECTLPSGSWDRLHPPI